MINVLSLFDGISIAKVSLDKLNIPINAYFSSEIDKYAMQVSQNNHKDIIRLGDIRYIKDIKVPIDLIIGGFPCQSFSIAGNQMGFEDKRGDLFYEALRLINLLKPKYFILENVASMSKENQNKISELLCIKPVMIDASLVSAQSRKRLFWVGRYNHIRNKYYNIEIGQPKDLNILLKDVIENGDVDRLKSYCLDASYSKGASWKQYKEKGRRQLVKLGYINNSDSQANRIYDFSGKSATLQSASGELGAKTGLYADGSTDAKLIRKLTPTECESLMGLNKGYTDGISNTQRYKCLGNGFHVDVICHILKAIYNIKD